MLQFVLFSFLFFFFSEWLLVQEYHVLFRGSKKIKHTMGIKEDNDTNFP